MYVAEGNQVFYCFPDETGQHMLFLTVHENNGSNIPVERQAIMVANTLNAMPIAIKDVD